ncbi:hypothetical protein ACFO5Q_04060 [Kordiimonas lipolytica]|uniref:Uncharacterized protein n=1 Tax=Kordiimonas lipolytica TaxID=1662421 RepID=A0ABV8U826_9PROT|nr:hypothetical protein [Kordiimonas lipolytica]
MKRAVHVANIALLMLLSACDNDQAQPEAGLMPQNAMITPADITPEMIEESQRQYAKWYAGLPKLSGKMLAQLQSIEPSNGFAGNWYPCSIELEDGSILENVYLIDGRSQENASYYGSWDQYLKNPQLSARIKAIRSSPNRLPKKHREFLYRIGESGMGYMHFTLVTNEGHEYAYTTGNFMDFMEMPDGVTYEDIKELIPHVPRRGDNRYGTLPDVKIYFQQ